MAGSLAGGVECICADEAQRFERGEVDSLGLHVQIDAHDVNKSLEAHAGRIEHSDAGAVLAR